MELLESVQFWTSVASIVLAVITFIAIVLIKKSIVDLLDKDKILFDKNFELKKKAIANALNLVDQLKNGQYDRDFNSLATACYNDLLCVATNEKVCEEFYALAISKTLTANSNNVAHFKVCCRKEIGFKAKFKKVEENVNEFSTANYVAPKHTKVEEDFTNIEPEIEEKPKSKAPAQKGRPRKK